MRGIDWEAVAIALAGTIVFSIFLLGAFDII